VNGVRDTHGIRHGGILPATNFMGIAVSAKARDVSAKARDVSEKARVVAEKARVVSAKARAVSAKTRQCYDKETGTRNKKLTRFVFGRTS